MHTLIPRATYEPIVKASMEAHKKQVEATKALYEDLEKESLWRDCEEWWKKQKMNPATYKRKFDEFKKSKIGKAI